MTEPWYFDRKGEIPAGKKPFFSIPAFNYYQAIKLFDELAASPRHSIRYQLQPGDIQLLSNHTVLHARSSFVDDAEDPVARRHLLRLWLAPPNEYPLPDTYIDVLGGSVEVGNRGGIIVDGTRLHVPLEAE